MVFAADRQYDRLEGRDRIVDLTLYILQLFKETNLSHG